MNFQLELQQYSLQEVTVSTNGEDPAYAIIRKAIGKRVEHLKEIKKFSADVYLKGQMQLRDYPKRFLVRRLTLKTEILAKEKCFCCLKQLPNIQSKSPIKKK